MGRGALRSAVSVALLVAVEASLLGFGAPANSAYEDLVAQLRAALTVPNAEARLQRYDGIAQSLVSEAVPSLGPQDSWSTLIANSDIDAVSAATRCSESTDSAGRLTVGSGIHEIAGGRWLFYRTYIEANGTSPAATLLAVSHPAEDWVHVDFAEDAEGNIFEVVNLGRTTNDDGSVDETVAVELPDGYLEGRAESGFKVRFKGGGNLLLAMAHGFTIRGFLAASERAVARKSSPRVPASR